MTRPPWLIAPGLVARDGKRHWLADLAAGLTVGAVSVPSAIAFAELARLPAAPGLYAAMAGLTAYALIGSARLLVVGADTATAVLSASAVATIATGATRPVDVAASLALTTGIVLVVAAVLRAGFLADFLSRPVLTGYVHGLIVTAIVAELGSLLRVPVDGTVAISGALDLAHEFENWHLASFALGVGCLALIALCRVISVRIPASLVVVVVATAVVWNRGLEREGIRVVGYVPKGVPTPHLPSLPLSDIGTLLLFGLGLAALTLADSTSVGRLFAAREHHTIAPNRELAALGTADVASGIVGGIAVSGSAPRTAVAWDARARSQVPNLVAAATIALTLLFFTEVIARIPRPALAAVVIAAVASIAEPRAFGEIYRVRHSEGVIAVVTFLSVVLLGVAAGMAVAVALSMLNVLRREARPHDAELGRVPNLHGWHDTARYAGAETVDGVLIFRFDAPLFFANAVALRDRLLERIDAAGRPIQVVIVDAEGITDVDNTSAEVLDDLLGVLRGRDIGLSFARMKGEVRDTLVRAGFVQRLGAAHFYPNVAGAVRGEAEVEPPDGD